MFYGPREVSIRLREISLHQIEYMDVIFEGVVRLAVETSASCIWLVTAKWIDHKKCPDGMVVLLDAFK